MSRLAVIALVIAAIIAFAYMLALMPGAPFGTPAEQEIQQPMSEESALQETLPEEQDLQSIQVDGLDQGLADIEAELAK